MSAVIAKKSFWASVGGVETHVHRGEFADSGDAVVVAYPGMFEALGGGGSQPHKTFAFDHTTPDLWKKPGVVAYTPSAGEVIYDAWIEVTEAWNGTSPGADCGLFRTAPPEPGHSDVALFFASNNPPPDLTLVWDATVQGFTNPYANQGVGSLLQQQAASFVKGPAPGMFVDNGPLCVIVTQGGYTTDGSLCTSDSAPTFPLTVVAATNDEFVFTGNGGAGTPETFTVAPGVYTTSADVRAAMAAAIGGSAERFDTICAVTGDDSAISLKMLGDNGANDNGNTISAGTHNVAADLGFTTDPNTFGSGSGGPTGATAGAAILHLLIF